MTVASSAFDIMRNAKPLAATNQATEQLRNDVFLATMEINADEFEISPQGDRKSLMDYAVEKRLRFLIPLLRMRGCAIQMWDCLAIENPVQHDDEELVLSYLEAGGSPHIRGNAGRSLLMVAASSCAEKVLQLFLDWGADVNDRSGFGSWTALMWSAHRGWEVGCKILLAAGAKVDDRNDQGMTAADIARQRGHAFLSEQL